VDPPVQVEGAAGHIAKARDMIKPIFDSAGCRMNMIYREQYIEIEGSGMVKFWLQGMWTPPPPTSPDPHMYRGWHGTSPQSMKSILVDKRLKPIPHPRGSGLLWFRAAEAPRADASASCLQQMWKSSWGYYGIGLEAVVVVDERHVRLDEGGHDEERKLSARGLVTKKAGRWTFPMDRIEIVAMWIHIDKASQFNFQDEMIKADTFEW
jgi:hypothetical protein